MPSTVTSTGFTLEPLDQRYADLQAQVQAIFGLTVNIDPSSIDGQTIGIYAESSNNCDQLAQAVYQSFDLDSATGAGLSRLVKLIGITRNLGSFGTVSISCGGQNGTVIPVGALIGASDQTSIWQVVVGGTIDNSGAVLVTAVCQTIGIVPAPEGLLTRRLTPIFGWQSVTNPGDATVGTPQETDEQLRIRAKNSTATRAQGIVEAVQGALENITGVTQVQVYENPEDTVDANGLTPHSIYCIVQGGDQQTILNTIWLKRSAGCTTLGSVSGPVIDSKGNTHTLRFDRPLETLIYVSMTVTRKAAWPSDGVEQMQAALVAWALANQLIGVDVIQSELYTPLNTVPGASISNLFIGTAPMPNSAADLPILFNAQASFDPSRIAINLV